MQYEIKHIHESLGVTIVYVTHDQSEALTMSNRVAVFNDGIIQQLATPNVLYEKPENAFCAQFIGENNKLMGTVKDKNGSKCIVEIPGSGVVHALDVNAGEIGGPTSLSLRPERVEIDPSEGKYPNVFDGQVKELIYLGDHIRTRVSVCGHDDFIVKVPNISDQSSLIKGHQVRVGWRADDCRALDVYEGL